jgi:hypothetical protein
MARASGLAAGHPQRDRGLEQNLNEEVFGVPDRPKTVGRLTSAGRVEVE